MGDDTNNKAEFLATICHEIDMPFGAGSPLCLEWLLDHYMAIEFRFYYSWIQKIHEYLVENNHHVNNKLEYFNDSEAFYVKKDKIICVFGKTYKDSTRYLVIDDKKDFDFYPYHKCWVRNIWKRTKATKWSVEHPTLKHYRDIDFDLAYSEVKAFRTYGDARDVGHVLTYDACFKEGKCDKVMWDVNAAKWFFFEVNTLWTQIEEMEKHD